jgi:hypothetical protein
MSLVKAARFIAKLSPAAVTSIFAGMGVGEPVSCCQLLSSSAAPPGAALHHALLSYWCCTAVCTVSLAATAAIQWLLHSAHWLPASVSHHDRPVHHCNSAMAAAARKMLTILLALNTSHLSVYLQQLVAQQLRLPCSSCPRTT